MSDLSRLLRRSALVAVAGLLAACTTSASPSASPEPSMEESMAASESPSEAADACAPESLETKTAGQLTIGTDNPAFPPYFDPPADDEEPTDPWELGDPTNGRGFESAVAWAVAEELGFGEDEVEWTVVPFDNSFAPGEKDFDFYLAQVSYTDERAEQVDMSDGYFFVNQALVAREGTAIADAASIADVAEFQLGVAQGTTSLSYIEEVIQPSQETMVYNDNDGAIDALNADQVQGIVVDLPTAFFITAVQMDDGVIVGQFPNQGEGDEQEHFSLVLELDSPLTDCVNEAIAALTESGELEAITEEWMSENAGAPVLE
jgi:polar amino acid transport system substrate-binding protein